MIRSAMVRRRMKGAAPGHPGFSHDDLRDRVRARIADQGEGHVVGRQGDHRRTELPGEVHVLSKRFLGRLPQGCPGVHEQGRPFRLEVECPLPCPPDEVGGVRAGADSHQETPARGARSFPRCLAKHVGELVIDEERGMPKGHLPQRRERALLEEVLHGRLGPVAEIHLAFREPFQELFGGDVDEHDLVGDIEDRVGDALGNGDARDLLHRVGEPLEVLDIHRGEDVDAVLGELQDVLVAFTVSRTGRVRVGQLVDQDELRLPRHDRIRVHFLERHPAVGDRHTGDELETGRQVVGVLPLVAFQVPDDDVGTLLLHPPGFQEHRERLADTGRHAEEDFELPLALLLLLRGAKEGIRIGSCRFLDRAHDASPQSIAAPRS